MWFHSLKWKMYNSPALHKHKKLPPLAEVQRMATDLLEVTVLPFMQLPRWHDVSAAAVASLAVNLQKYAGYLTSSTQRVNRVHAMM